MGRVIDMVQSIPSGSSAEEQLFPFAAGLSVMFLIGALCNAGRIYLLLSSGEAVLNSVCLV